MKKIEDQTIELVGATIGAGAEILTATVLSEALCETDKKKSLGFKIGVYLVSASVSAIVRDKVKKSVVELGSLYNNVVDLVEKTKVDVINSEMSQED